MHSIERHSSGNNQMKPVMEFTGERMVPEGADPTTFWEHIYRYRFARRFVTSKTVLDIACGEGYGSAALLRAGAARVTGVDVSEATCLHAATKYGTSAVCGNAENIPVATNSIDVVVSFETIEHLLEPEKFVLECWRVLKPGGVLVISTPNRPVYNHSDLSVGPKEPNPFHEIEYSYQEFIALLRLRFNLMRVYSQWPRTISRWSPYSLSAYEYPWEGARGFWRLRQVLREKTCYHLWNDITSEIRASSVELICSTDSFLASMVNPYCVKPFHLRSREEPRYFVIVAAKES